MLQKQIAKVFGLLLSLVALPAVAFGAGASTDEFASEWKALIAAAQAEGEVVISVGGGGRTDRPIINHFAKKFGIKAIISAGRGSEQTNRLLAEQSAGRFGVDVLMIDATNGNRLIQARALTPIRKLLVHPDAIDPSKWFGNRMWFADPEEQFIVNHSASASPLNIGMRYNTNLLSQKEIEGFNSVYDYLDPKWAGKVVSLPPTIGGGVGDYVTVLLHPDVGEEWLRRYFKKAFKAFFTEDSRIVSDGIANGRFKFGIALSTAGREVDALGRAGAPVKRMVRPFKERPILGGSGPSANLEAVKKPPHPAAQKLFVNWLLTREGQLARLKFAARHTDPSLRKDVKCAGQVDLEDCRKPSETYLI